MSCLAPTKRLLAARTAFQEFGRMPQKRDPDYVDSGKPIHSFNDMFSGYLFPMSTFTSAKPSYLRSGEPSMLHWYTLKGMTKKEAKVGKFKEWYKEALGSVQYMDGFDYPELQNGDDLLKINGDEEGAWNDIAVVRTGKAGEFVTELKNLRDNPSRVKKDVEALIAKFVQWTDPTVAGYSGAEVIPSDVLAGQPLSVYETLLLLCAEAQDWINTTALVREMGHRNVHLRAPVAAALFNYIQTAQTALNLFEVLKKEGVKIHLHTYQAMLRVLDRIEESDRGMAFKAQWEETGDVSGDMMDFILNGSEDTLFPETSPYLNTVSNQDPKVEVERAISELLHVDRAQM
eukprot:TRINITY_DN584_c2_g2_i1.p1 TRINITY_DN584_c2_g2~~TRINITY_DN584_c2_g2_i1.p1  ORF type:complete len:345 (+),score=55.04 TRINITY_DN584_c2_g2_i1:46-1080(+)